MKKLKLIKPLTLGQIKSEQYKLYKLSKINIDSNKIKKFYKKLIFYIYFPFVRAWYECRDWKTLLILFLVNAFYSSPIWLGLSLGIIFHNPALIAIGTTWQIIYNLPIWFPLCLITTFKIKEVFNI